MPYKLIVDSSETEQLVEKDFIIHDNGFKLFSIPYSVTVQSITTSRSTIIIIIIDNELIESNAAYRIVARSTTINQ
jgi:hypothetical protein